MMIARCGSPEPSSPVTLPVSREFPHGGKVWHVVFARDGKTLATASEDKTLRLWDPVTGQLKATLPAYPRREVGPLALDVSPDSRFLATGGGDSIIRTWPATGTAKAAELEGHGREISAVVFGPRPDRLASASYDRSVRLWNLLTGQTLATYSEFQDPVLSLAWSPDGTMLAAGAMNGGVRLIDPNNGKVLGQAGHPKRVWALAFSPDSRTLATGSHDGMVKLWSLPRVDGQPARDLVEGPEVWSVAFSPTVPRSPPAATTALSASGVRIPAASLAASPFTRDPSSRSRSRRTAAISRPGVGTTWRCSGTSPGQSLKASERGVGHIDEWH